MLRLTRTDLHLSLVLFIATIIFVQINLPVLKKRLLKKVSKPGIKSVRQPPPPPPQLVWTPQVKNRVISKPKKLLQVTEYRTGSSFTSELFNQNPKGFYSALENFEFINRILE